MSMSGTSTSLCNLVLLLAAAMCVHSGTSVTADSTAAAAAARATPLVSLDSDSVRDLLSEWNLQSVFHEHQLDGEMLAMMTAGDVEAEIRALLPHSLARSYHWRKLFARVQERLAEDREVESERGRNLQAGALRTSATAAAATSGIHIKSNSSSMLLGPLGDVALRRAGDAHLLINNSVTISGDLNVVAEGRVSIQDEDDGSTIDVFRRLQKLTRRQAGLSDEIQALNQTLQEYGSSSDSSGHGSDAFGWTHVASFGCSNVLTGDSYGSEGDECWKLSDTDINALMCGSELKVEFYSTADTLFVQLVDLDGELRDWHYDPTPNTAKWRWVDTLPWKGPCTHDSQTSNGHFFFFKTGTRYGDCASSNYENSVYDPSSTSYEGFINRDSTSSHSSRERSE